MSENQPPQLNKKEERMRHAERKHLVKR